MGLDKGFLKNVSLNPETATKAQIRDAIRDLSYRRASLILSARRRKVEPRGIAAIDTRLAFYAKLVNGSK